MESLNFDIKKLKRRDEAEWTKVHSQCVHAVFSFLMRRTGNRVEAAKDLTQQAFLNAYNSIHNFDEGRANFLAWLLGIARRDNYYLKHEAREITSSEMTAMSEEWGKDRTPSLNPREEMTRLQEDEFLEVILGMLPEQQERALRLRYVEELSHKEIGKRLNLSEKAAAETVRRGRLKLQKAFFDAYPFLAPPTPVPQESVG